jgi:predicted TIM-barrel fold metal-dependent hydrolase
MSTPARLVTWLPIIAIGACAEITDHHQHLFSPAAAAHASPGVKEIGARDLIVRLDEAGIERAVVLSVAYSLANPNKARFANEYPLVRAENDWTATQVALFPDRLEGFCSVNPLRDYALKEIARCAKNPHLRTGLKLHFGNSDVNVNDPAQLAQLKRVFRAANRNHMALAVHMRANWDHNRPYGTNEARVFLERLVPEAPDVTIQIAHLAGGGGSGTWPPTRPARSSPRLPPATIRG